MTDDLELRILRRLAHTAEVIVSSTHPQFYRGLAQMDDEHFHALDVATADYLAWKRDHWICGNCHRAYPKTVTPCEACGP